MTDERVSLERAKAILARATEIETQLSGSISLNDLRSIDREAGIAETAVDMAIREEAGVPQPQYEAHQLRISWPMRGLVAGITLGSATGLVINGLNPGMGAFLGTSAVMMTAGIFAGVMRRSHKHLPFQLANVALWFGYLGARLVLGGGLGSSALAQVIVPGFMAVVATGIIGAASVGLRDASQPGSGGGDGAARPPVRIVVARAKAALRGVWENLNTPLWREKRRGECSHVI